jgi:hypothetical protein
MSNENGNREIQGDNQHEQEVAEARAAGPIVDHAAKQVAGAVPAGSTVAVIAVINGHMVHAVKSADDRDLSMIGAVFLRHAIGSLEIE